MMGDAIAQPTDTYRWLTRDCLQRMHVTVIGADYIADEPTDGDHLPVWTQDEALKGRLWRPVRGEWRDDIRILQ